MPENWKHLFAQRILNRGLDYNLNGRVSNLRRIHDGYAADVSGSSEYHVEIFTDENDRITGMDCDCPYAEDGHCCKHMAAVLYEIEESGLAASVGKESPDESAENILDRMNEEALRKELRQILNDNPILKHAFFQRHRRGSLTTREIRAFGNSLERIAYEVGDRNGFVDWRHGSDYVSAFYVHLNDFLQPAVERGEYMNVFNALKDAFRTANHVEMDGSDGEHNELGEIISGYWKTIIPSASETEKDEMYAWFGNIVRNHGSWILTDTAQYAMEHFFTEEKYIRPLLENVISRLNTTDSDSYTVIPLLEAYREYLSRLNLPEEEMSEWIEEHRNWKSVRDYLIREAEKSGDDDALIPLLKERLEKDEIGWRKTAAAIDLMHIYQKRGDTEKEKQYLAMLILEYNADMHEDMMRLRSLCSPDEWKGYRDRIIQLHPSHAPSLYFEDHMYRELMDLLPYCDISVADTYREELQKEFPEEISDVYYQYVLSLVQMHPSASTYSVMESHLNYLTDTEPGRTAFLGMKEDLEKRYPTRKSLLKLLNRIYDEKLMTFRII